jgi:hypothetical protein
MQSPNLAPTIRADETRNPVKQRWVAQIALKIKSPTLEACDADHRPIPQYG